jgi:hypothetical protein
MFSRWLGFPANLCDKQRIMPFWQSRSFGLLPMTAISCVCYLCDAPLESPANAKIPHDVRVDHVA